jgi:hypothetical protein
MGPPQALYLNAALAGWLAVSAFALPGNVGTSLNNVLVAVLLFVVSMVRLSTHPPRHGWHRHPRAARS